MSPFFFGNNFYKNMETFNIFSPQILEVYRILWVETTLESLMICYTFWVINTIFVPCTALLYDSTAATQTLNLSTILLCISCTIHLIPFLMMSFLFCGLFSQIVNPSENSQVGWDLGNRMARDYRFDAKWVSVPWEVMPWGLQVLNQDWFK